MTSSSDDNLNKTNGFNLSGRLGRLSFIAWLVFFHLLIFCIGTIFDVGFSLLQLNSTPSLAWLWQTGAELNGLFSLIFTLFYFYGLVVITAKRLHDTDHRAWWMLLSFIPLLNVFLFLYLILRSGSTGNNAYGTPRATPSIEKITAWLFIILLVLSLSWLWSIFQWVFTQDYLQLPQEVLQKTSDYF